MFFQVVGQFGAIDDDLPDWCSSSRLMQRISVDLPEPEGPGDDDPLALADIQVDVAQDVKMPYHLFSLAISMAVSSPVRASAWGRGLHGHEGAPQRWSRFSRRSRYME